MLSAAAQSGLRSGLEDLRSRAGRKVLQGLRNRAAAGPAARGTESQSNEPSQNPKSAGHHAVPGEIYRNQPLKPETRKVFESATTGPVGDEPHRYDKEHRQYNQAVKEAFERFKAANGILSESMTPEQAKEFSMKLERRQTRAFGTST